ncbi:MAG: glycoside hydrolase family 172 protein [Chthonomonadales bacterium]
MLITRRISVFAALLVASCLPAFAQDDAGPLAGLAKAQSGRSMRASTTFRMGKDGKYDPNADPTGDLKEHSNSDNFRVAAGKTHTLMNVKGPGVITHLWLTFLGPEPQEWAKNGSANHLEMLLRIYWDDNPKPAVEAPIGDFFASCFGKRSEVISMPVILDDGDAYNCFWRMPFRKSARVEIVNQSDKDINLLYYNVDWIKKDSLPKDTPYFYAQYRQEYPVEHGKDYVLLDTKGKGHYVGTVLAVRTRSPMWFGEGDEKIYIDNEEKPSIWGTGTEDYFLAAWGLKKNMTPYFGTSYFDQWGIVGGHTAAFRWHVNDPLVFSKGIKVTFEHFGWVSPDENTDHVTNSWNEREDDFSSVAFWYQTGNPTFTARAPDAKARNLPSLERVQAFARDFTANQYHGDGGITTQQLDLYDKPQLLYMPQKEANAWLEIPLEVTKKEPLRLVINATKSYDFGKYQAYLNGIKVGGVIDLYNKEVANEEVHLLDFWPDPGKYTLRLECVGKNPASQGYLIGLESVCLRERRPRVLQLGFDKNNDWKKNPILYR